MTPGNLGITKTVILLIYFLCMTLHVCNPTAGSQLLTGEIISRGMHVERMEIRRGKADVRDGVWMVDACAGYTVGGD